MHQETRLNGKSFIAEVLVLAWTADALLLSSQVMSPDRTTLSVDPWRGQAIVEANQGLVGPAVLACSQLDYQILPP